MEPGEEKSQEGRGRKRRRKKDEKKRSPLVTVCLPSEGKKANDSETGKQTLLGERRKDKNTRTNAHTDTSQENKEREPLLRHNSRTRPRRRQGCKEDAKPKVRSMTTTLAAAASLLQALQRFSCRRCRCCRCGSRTHSTQGIKRKVRGLLGALPHPGPCYVPKPCRNEAARRPHQDKL